MCLPLPQLGNGDGLQLVVEGIEGEVDLGVLEGLVETVLVIVGGGKREVSSELGAAVDGFSDFGLIDFLEPVFYAQFQLELHTQLHHTAQLCLQGEGAFQTFAGF